jgi:alkylation response protein AidB-like acyl-CoA dehydrogenase
LSAERGPAGFDVIARLGVRLSRLRQRSDPHNTAVAARLAILEARWLAVQSLALDLIDIDERGGETFRLTSALKVAQSELLQEITDCCCLIDGDETLQSASMPHPLGYVTGRWAADWVGSWAWTISGGSNEIQRTIIAEKVLGLPREPRPAVIGDGAAR